MVNDCFRFRLSMKYLGLYTEKLFKNKTIVSYLLNGIFYDFLVTPNVNRYYRWGLGLYKS